MALLNKRMTLANKQKLFDVFSVEMADLKVIAADDGQDKEVRELAQEGVEFIGEYLARMQAQRPVIEGAVQL